MHGMRVGLAIAVLAVLLTLPGRALARTFEVNRTSDPPPGECTAGDCTLREAVVAANERDGKDAVVLRSGRRYTLEQPGAGEDLAQTGDLDVTDPLKLTTDRGGRARVFANELDRALDFHARGSVSRLAISGGVVSTGERGGGIAGDAPVKVLRSSIKDNQAGNAAGGVYLLDGGSIKRSVLSGNESSANGGALWVFGDPEQPFVIERTRTTDNEAGLFPGSRPRAATC